MASKIAELPLRRSLRLIGHDYSGSGVYFVTLCVAGMQCSLGEVNQGVMKHSPLGAIVAEEWQHTDSLRPEIILDEFIVMPNHFHAILWIKTGPSIKSQAKAGPKSGSVGAIIAQFKAASTRRINSLRNSPGITFWQRNYFDRIIRDDEELNRTRHYIRLNPYQWAGDEYHR